MRAVLIPVVTTLIILATGPALAQVTDKDKQAFRHIVTEQIKTFRDDNAEKAFSYAVSALQERYGTPERFMKQIRTRYPAVFLPKQFTFGKVTDETGRPTQHVNVVGPHGIPWLALYGFEKQSDGGWRVAGVTLRPLDPAKTQKASPAEGERLVAALAPKGGAIRFAASFNKRTRQIVVIKVGEQEAEGKDFDLWLIEGNKPPASLGLVDGKGLKAPAVPAKLQAAFAEGATLAISVEPKGGSTTGAPTGPVIATGPVQKF